MNGFLRSSIVCAAIAATALATIPTASADHWRHHGPKVHAHKYRHSDDALAAGLLGAAIGALAVGLLSQPPRSAPVYIDPPRRTPHSYRYRDGHYPPTHAYTGTTHRSAASEPWTAEWFRACSNRYVSFDGRSGTFLGFDGKRHFCVLK